MMNVKTVWVSLLIQTVSFVLSTPPTCDIRYDQTLQGPVADCSRRNLTSVPRDLPGNIVALNLKENLFTEITGEIFKSFSNLTHLDLSQNAIEGFDKNAFFGLHQLVKLDLRGSRYLDNGSYPRGLFDSTENITSLYLGGNVRIDSIFPSYIFVHLSNLLKLTLEDSWPRSHQGKDFSRLKTLESLTVLIQSSHKVQNFKNDTFLYLESVPLHNLTIACNILAMDGCVFCPLKNLTNLQVNTRYRSSITLKGVTRSFYGFAIRPTPVNEIILSGVQRRSADDTDTILDRKVLGFLSDMCVKRLDLSNNRLMAIKTVFKPHDRLTKCIEYLDLSSNFMQFDFNLFFNLANMIKLVSLDISQNANRLFIRPKSFLSKHSEQKYVKTRPLGSMNGRVIHVPLPPKLEYLNCSYIGNLISFRVDFNFSNGTNLRIVDISHNVAFDSPAKVFGLFSVSYLDISGMTVEESALTNMDMFRGVETLIARDTNTFPKLLMSEDSAFFHLMNRLKHLDVSGNGLEVINDNTFSRLRNVHTLILSRNRLSYTPGEILNMPVLTSLDLSFNSINVIGKQKRKLLDDKWQTHNKLSLNLLGNTFTCVCDTLDFIQWLHETRITLSKLGNYTCLTEYGAMTFTKQFYDNILLHWRQCVGQFWLAVAVFLQLILIISLMSAFLLKKYFPKLEHHILQWLGRMEPKRWDYEYDAYICYGDKDYKWPCHCLYQQLLEKDESVKLYVPDLHDPFGEVKAEVIHVAIKKSWKLIIVVTEDLFTDEWSHFKMLEALRLFSKEGVITSRILLLYQDISPEAKDRVPSVLLNVIPSKNILHVNPGDGFWAELHQKIIKIKTEVIHDAISKSWKLISVATENVFMDEWSYYKVLEALRLFSQEDVITNRIILLHHGVSFETKTQIPKVLLNVVPRLNILQVYPGDEFIRRSSVKI